MLITPGARLALLAAAVPLAAALASPRGILAAGPGRADTGRGGTAIRVAAAASDPAVTVTTAPRTALAIIVNRNNPIASLGRRELRALFLGERTTWPHGRRVTLVLREPGVPERAAAVRLIAGMSEDDLARHFIHQTFSGAGASGPRALATADGVKRFVFNVPGAIGVIRAADLDDTVKSVRITGDGPTDPHYSLVVGES